LRPPCFEAIFSGMSFGTTVFQRIWPREGQMFGQNTAAWQGIWPRSWQSTWQSTWQDAWEDVRQGAEALAQRMAAGGKEAQRDFWHKIQRGAANLPFAEDVLTAHYCAFDRQTPLHVKAALLGAIAYFIVPDDLIPDSIPVLGLADDAAVLAAAMKLFSSHIKPEHRQAAARKLAQLRA
jgi:uncharacterized membrane protein YkvA (DUF1232 family)